MFNFMLAMLMYCSPEPACFEIHIESKTPMSIYLNGQQIEPDTKYRTEPLFETTCVELEVRYVDGDKVKTKFLYLDLTPGYKVTYTLKINTWATLAWC